MVERFPRTEKQTQQQTCAVRPSLVGSCKKCPGLTHRETTKLPLGKVVLWPLFPSPSATSASFEMPPTSPSNRYYHVLNCSAEPKRYACVLMYITTYRNLKNGIISSWLGLSCPKWTTWSSNWNVLCLADQSFQFQKRYPFWTAP